MDKDNFLYGITIEEQTELSGLLSKYIEWYRNDFDKSAYEDTYHKDLEDLYKLSVRLEEKSKSCDL